MARKIVDAIEFARRYSKTFKPISAEDVGSVWEEVCERSSDNIPAGIFKTYRFNEHLESESYIAFTHDETTYLYRPSFGATYDDDDCYDDDARYNREDVDEFFYGPDKDEIEFWKGENYV